MKVTIGGDRLGSGNKLRTNLNNYQLSTHNLGQKFTSSMTVGALYPFLVLPAMRDDKFTIDLEAAARTIPTQGPLYGSFKMQLDVFQCPVRLYQAILHNNPLKIGLQMSEVKFPMLRSWARGVKADHYKNMKFNNSSLIKYLGASGLGRFVPQESDPAYKDVCRDFNAIPALAYYDIFKTYYSNKQEEKAYVITSDPIEEISNIKEWTDVSDNKRNLEEDLKIEMTEPNPYITGAIKFDKRITKDEFISQVKFTFSGINSDDEWDGEVIYTIEDAISDGAFVDTHLFTQLNEEALNGDTKSDIWLYRIQLDEQTIIDNLNGAQGTIVGLAYKLVYDDSYSQYTVKAADTEYEIKLKDFNLSNIDAMRLKLLSFNNLGQAFYIDATESDDDDNWGYDSGDDQTGLPYKVLSANDLSNKEPRNSTPLNGLVIKTYQSDIFNCWVNTEWIDGENGIAAITAVSTSEGSFTMDSLNLAEKLYDMLNRIAVSDGTYESWQDTVYTESPRRHIESPVYLGGMSTEIVFEEIVQTTPTADEPLGNMGGRGVLMKRKGGHVVVKCDEASFIIGIVSLTPRLNYTQGNEFYMTDLKSMDDLHKPALDGIGFQNLMAERLAWFGSGISGNSGNTSVRQIVGKVPAWLEYMTAVDKAYGDFAEDGGKSFMVLNRNYEHLPNGGGISDATTYIDPTKYNYAFANTKLTAQNFWVQIKSHVTARRLMSAKQIPNL